jgi:hypothetical protein
MVAKMDSLLCPNCGTPNPPDNEVCQHCQASLPLENIQMGDEVDLPESPEGAEDSKGSLDLDNAFIGAFDDIESITGLPDEDLDMTIDELYEEDAKPEESESENTFPEWLISLAERDFSEEVTETESDLTSKLEESVSEIEEKGEETDQLVEDMGEESELEPARLPEWLEAMRPVDFVAQTLPIRDAPEERLESAGPLAGIWGALQSEAEIAGEGEPKGNSVALIVSENHRIHAELLQGMIEGEVSPRSLPARKEDVTQTPLRWIIAIILFITILWSLISNSNPQNPSSLEPPPEVVSVFNLVNTLSAEDKVLIAFEYEPGLSPELDAAAQPVIDHLLVRDAYLTLVSTSPVGPLLAERHFDATQNHHPISKDINYVNLGYIPASTAGLLSFSQNPQRILPLTIESELAWGGVDYDALPPLKGIFGVEDYKLVLVIVDQPDVARAWIEQVLPFLRASLPPTPLVMISSAQSEPLIRPYYEAIPRQIQGLVTGLAGGTSYAKLTGRDNLATGYWGAFDMGLIAASLLILLGGVIIVFINLRSQHKDINGDTKE